MIRKYIVLHKDDNSTSICFSLDGDRPFIGSLENANKVVRDLEKKYPDEVYFVAPVHLPDEKKVVEKVVQKTQKKKPVTRSKKAIIPEIPF